MTPADLETLRDSHAACALGAEAGDADRYYYDNERFHFSIYEASHNSFLIEQAKALHRRLQPYRRLQLRVRNRLATSYQEHDAILAALVDGDSARAATLLRDHVAVQGERFADLVASLRDLKQGPRNAALAS